MSATVPAFVFYAVQYQKIMLLVLAALGVAFSVLIVTAAASGASSLRRRQAASDDKVFAKCSACTEFRCTHSLTSESNAAQELQQKVEPPGRKTNEDYFRSGCAITSCVAMSVYIRKLFQRRFKVRSLMLQAVLHCDSLYLSGGAGCNCLDRKGTLV